MKSFYIAGVQHHPGRNAVGKELGLETELDLVPEPTNKFDPNAVRIEYDSHMLGYVPKRMSAEVAMLLEIEEPLRCIVEHIDHSAQPWEWCRVTIKGEGEEDG